MKRKLLVIGILLLALLLSGCMSEEEEAFQGTWYYISDHFLPLVGESDLEVVWAFDHGYFKMQACCFNQDDSYSGYYRITEIDENEISLELMDIKNHGVPQTGNMIVNIELLDDSEWIMINWAGPFERISER